MEVAISGTKFSYFYIYYNNSKILIYIVWKSLEVFIKFINILRKIDKIDNNNNTTNLIIKS